jgi:hypothetical protein
MTLNGKILLATVAALGLTATVSQAQIWYPRPGQRDDRGRYNRIDELAVRLERQTQALNREVDTHFRNTPAYRHLERDVDDLVRKADHIHRVAHNTRDRGHLREDVNEFERQLRHVDRLVHELPRRFGSIDRTAIAHIHRAIERVQDAVNDLQRAL